MIDLHCHVLAGLDDGPETVDQAVALVRAARSAGAEKLVATPHVNLRYRNRGATIARAAGELKDRQGREPDLTDVEVLRGAEIAFACMPELTDDELASLTLGGGSWLLLEPPAGQVAPGIAAMVEDLHARGHRVVLAHPERCPVFHRDPKLLHSLADAGVLTSITAGSLVGRFGGIVRRFTSELLEAGMVHNVASDFHSLERRPPGTAEALAQAGLGALAQWLTHDVPAAILEDREIPRKPAGASVAIAPTQGKRRFAWRLRS
jgi:protein-tyrosine phosphatase